MDRDRRYVCFKNIHVKRRAVVDHLLLLLLAIQYCPMNRICSESTRGADYTKADHSTFLPRTDTAAVVNHTALEDALLAQTPTAPALRRQLVVHTYPLVDAAVAPRRAEIPIADAHLRRETDTKHPGAIATGPDLALRLP